MPSSALNLISTAELHRLILNLDGSKAASKALCAIMPTPGQSPSVFHDKKDVALVVGGGGDPLSEFDAARLMCEAAGKTYTTLVCNDLLALFPHRIDFACTLHPDKMIAWTVLREKNGHPLPYGSTWAHRPYKNFTNHTKDWQGSSGLFMTKIARETGYTHIILCGVPMTVEAEHFVRHQRWNAAPGFIRGWNHHEAQLRPFVRSMSGWTQATFGSPSFLWLTESIPDPRPLRPEAGGMKA